MSSNGAVGAKETLRESTAHIAQVVDIILFFNRNTDISIFR